MDSSPPQGAESSLADVFIPGIVLLCIWLSTPAIGHGLSPLLSLQPEAARLGAFLTLVIGVGMLIASLLYARRAPPGRTPQAFAPGLAGVATTRLQPILCQRCGAPQSLGRTGGVCTHCSAPTPLPADYVETLPLRAQAARGLARAERWLRWAEALSSGWAIASIMLGGIAWTALVCALLRVAGQALPGWLEFLAFAEAMFVEAAAFAVGLYLVVLRPGLPVIPRRQALLAEPHADARCSACGAPVGFEATSFSCLCRYCGRETYRAGFTLRARRSAGQEAAQVESALSAVARALEERTYGAATAYYLASCFLFVLGVWSALIHISIVLALLVTTALACAAMWLLWPDSRPWNN